MEASRSAIRGPVIPPGEEGYDQVRRVGPDDAAFVPRAADYYLNLATSRYDPTNPFPLNQSIRPATARPNAEKEARRTCCRSA